MEVDSKRKNWIIITLIILILLGTFLYAYLTKGQLGIQAVIDSMVGMLFWIMFIGLVVGVLYFLFLYEKKINATVEVFKNISSESKVSCPDNLGNLYTAGDESHRGKKIGKIIGYSNRQNFKVNNKKYQSEDCFLVRKKTHSLLKNLIYFFTSPIMVRVPEDMHDSLQGDVKVNCLSLVKHGLFFYPNNIHLDFDAIDHTIYYEGERYVQIEAISILAPLVKKSIGIDYKDLMMLEGKSGMDIINEIRRGK